MCKLQVVKCELNWNLFAKTPFFASSIASSTTPFMSLSSSSKLSTSLKQAIISLQGMAKKGSAKYQGNFSNNFDKK